MFFYLELESSSSRHEYDDVNAMYHKANVDEAAHHPGKRQQFQAMVAAGNLHKPNNNASAIFHELHCVEPPWFHFFGMSQSLAFKSSLFR